MKKCAAFAVVVFVALFASLSTASAGSPGQPSPSSQFRLKRKVSLRPNSNTGSGQFRSSAPGVYLRPPMLGPAASGPAANTHASTQPHGSSSTPSTVNFVSAALSPLGGQDDDETEPVMGDFNGDGKMDVAKITSVTSGSTTTYQISTLLGNGDGTFKAPKITDTPGDLDDPIVTGSLRGNGEDDIIQIHPDQEDDCDSARGVKAKPRTKVGSKQEDICGSSMDVLLSNGDGTFAAAVNYPISFNFLAGGLLTDVNGDGKLDVLVFDDNNPANVLVLYGNGDGTFQTATTLTTLSAAAPNAMFFADFNGDGKLDFAGNVEGQVQVTLATSSTTWGTPALLVTPDGAYNSDFNTSGDLKTNGKPDIVSVNYDWNTITIYVNNGDGTFQTGVYYDCNFNYDDYSYGAAIADINGDGNNDIVVSNEYSGNITVFLGHGDGTVTVEDLSYAVGGYPWYTPLLADFNGDGLIDVVIPNEISSMVYLQGYGDGTFHAAPNYPLPNTFQGDAYTESVATGDFNGDGIPDIVVGTVHNYGSTGVAVYLGKGDGTFYPGVSYGDSVTLAFVTVADFNGDGKLDIAATDYANDVVQIFLGNGDGTFNIAGAYPTDSAEGPYPQGIATGDFNKDGKVDLAIANSGSGTVGVLLGNGDGTFGNLANYALVTSFPQNVAVADLNNDGFVDIGVTVDIDGNGFIGILLNKADQSGTFNAPAYVDLTANPSSLAFGDLNGDGKLDMAVTIPPNTVVTALGNGDGTFQAPVAYPSSLLGGNSDPADIQMIDINGDGKLDLLFLNDDNGTLAVALGNGNGSVADPTEFPVVGYAWGMALADFNNDGAIDVVAGNDESGGFGILLNGNGSGTAPNYSIGTSTPSSSVPAGTSATYTLNLVGLNGYNGTITFSCGSLPSGAACSFSPASVVANAGTPLTTTLTVTTTAPTTASLSLPTAPNTQPGSPILLASFGGFGVIGMLIAGTGKKGRQRRAAIQLTVLLLVTIGTLVACGGSSTGKSSTPPPASTGTPAGNYVVTVTSTGTGTNAPTHAVSMTLVVQ